MRIRIWRRGKEKGATVVEFALTISLLLMLVLGAFEYGMALRDWLSVTIGTREGARVAASAANYGEADCAILEATAGALQSFRSGQIREVHIYKSDENGAYPANSLMNRYEPFVSAPQVPIPACPFWTVMPGGIGGGWDANDRVSSTPGADPFWIGVRLVYDHDWYTGFLWWNGTARFTDDAIFKIEPPPPFATTTSP